MGKKRVCLVLTTKSGEKFTVFKKLSTKVIKKLKPAVPEECGIDVFEANTYTLEKIQEEESKGGTFSFSDSEYLWLMDEAYLSGMDKDTYLSLLSKGWLIPCPAGIYEFYHIKFNGNYDGAYLYHGNKNMFDFIKIPYPNFGTDGMQESYPLCTWIDKEEVKVGEIVPSEDGRSTVRAASARYQKLIEANIKIANLMGDMIGNPDLLRTASNDKDFKPVNIGLLAVAMAYKGELKFPRAVTSKFHTTSWADNIGFMKIYGTQLAYLCERADVNGCLPFLVVQESGTNTYRVILDTPSKVLKLLKDESGPRAYSKSYMLCTNLEAFFELVVAGGNYESFLDYLKDTLKVGIDVDESYRELVAVAEGDVENAHEYDFIGRFKAAITPKRVVEPVEEE